MLSTEVEKSEGAHKDDSITMSKTLSLCTPCVGLVATSRLRFRYIVYYIPGTACWWLLGS